MGAEASKPTPLPSEKEQLQERARTDAASTAALLARLSVSHRPSTATVPLAGVAEWQKSFEQDAKSRLAGTMISKTDFMPALIKSEAANKDCMVFNHQVSTVPTPVTNQKSSGRCWLFATCNVIRTGIVKKFNLGDFELSQSYLFFWDSLEKANYFLESSIELSNEPLDSRLLSHLATAPESDGGQFDMVVNLIEKYGLVPKAIYPESYHSSNSSHLNSFLTSKLRDMALELRSLVDANEDLLGKEDRLQVREIAVKRARSAKQAMMADVYRILAITLGPPPAPDAKFLWEYNDKNGKTHNLTASPLEFYHNHCAGFKASDYISLINDPRNPYDALYTVDRLGNVWEGRPVLYVNVPMETIKETIIKMIKADQPVWFGCDVGKSSDTALGIMDADLFAYDEAFGTTVGLSKAERLQMQDSAMTHAMVIPAVHVDDNNKLVRCKVENSWSESAGSKGYFVMTDKWMDEYLFQIVVPRTMVSPHLRDIFENAKPTALPPWDPMGSLA